VLGPAIAVDADDVLAGRQQLEDLGVVRAGGASRAQWITTSASKARIASTSRVAITPVGGLLAISPASRPALASP
jgi:hypothetical protein